MATATLTLIGHTEIDDADTNTSWSTLTSADADILKEGAASMSGILRSDGDNGYYDDGTPRSTSGEHLRIWINTINAPYMEDAAGGGYQVFVYDGTNTDYYTVFSSDDYTGGWFNAVIDCSLFTTVTPANVQRWGLYANHTGNAKNAVNTWVDYIRYMDGYSITGGVNSDPVTLADIYTADAGTTTLYGYGIIEEYEGAYFAYGEVQFGNGATATYIEMDGDVLTFTDKPVADGLYALNGNGSGCEIVITNSTIKASGTGDNNRPDVDMSTGSPSAVSIIATVFIRGGTFTFDSGQTITGNTFNDCEQITAGGADMSGCDIVGYEGTTSTGALIWNELLDTDGYLDDMSFTKGTADTHAIQFGTSAPNSGESVTSMTLRGIAFSGYHASDGQNSSTLYFPDTGSDVTWTVYLVGCSGNISYKQARVGDTVNLVPDPVTTGVTVYDGGTSPPSLLSGARVLLYCSEYVSGAGFPYQESVSITGSGTTATVTHTAHGLVTGDYVLIRGVENDDDYNGVYQITYISANSYSYTASGTLTSPATGTSITATFAFISGTTDGSGYISDSRVVGDDQPVVGWARKSTSSPFFKEGPIVGTISSTGGLSVTVQLTRDE